MEKILRRSALIKSQTRRKARIHAEKETTRDRVNFRVQNGALLRENYAAIRQSRLMRREQWELGSLSPWIESASFGHTNSLAYGTFTVRKMNPPKVPEAYRVKDWFIREGDRVCVVQGGEGVKGKIGTVKSLDKETEHVTVEGINMIDIRVPPPMLTPGATPIHTVEAPLPLSSLRLVFPLPDPTTGIPRDCIITNLVKRDTHFDIYENETVWSRVLMPQNTRIPWPEKDEPSFQDEAVDTLRIDVEEKTFLPTLLRPPMPNGIIDELRNRYGKFRDRHDDEWVAMKKAEDLETKRKEDLSRSMMPRGARNIARVHPSSRGGTFMTDGKAPKVPDEYLEILGAHMAAKGVGMVKVVASQIASPPSDHRLVGAQDSAVP